MWLLVTSYNLFKPYRIDDGAHLFIAKWLMAHPFHPMRGILNWSGFDEPIWHTNQPHLFFYLLALWATVFGFGEPALHTLMALFALACVLLFHRLCRTLMPGSALWGTALLILGPAFVVEQNIMVDVPLLATWLAFFAVLICDVRVDERRQTRRYLVAALACSAALLIKYSSVVLFPVLCFSILAERRWRQAWTAAVPIAVVSAWSAFNYLDYGGVHIAERPHSSPLNLHHLAWFSSEWLTGIGALTPVGVIALVRSARPSARTEFIAYAVLLGLGAGWVVLVATGAMADRTSDHFVLIGCFIDGWLALLVTLPAIGRVGRPTVWTASARGLASAAMPEALLLLWLLVTSAFYILFSPFVAARHVLLVLPPIILLSGMRGNARRAAQGFGLCVVVFLSVGLGVSDWRLAAFSRMEAATLSRSLASGGGRLWTNGHWGWQWYAARHGIREIDLDRTVLGRGDLLIGTDQPGFAVPRTDGPLHLVRTDVEQDPLLNLICAGRPARFYAFVERQAPWSVSRDCLAHVNVFRVD